MGVLTTGNSRLGTRYRGKRGQLQVQETILTVFIFVIIIIIGMTVFFRYQENSLKTELRDFRIEQLGNKILTTPDSSEFVYTEAGIKKNAVDVLKLTAFQNLVQKKKKYYNEKLGYMNITVVQVYPEKIKEKCNGKVSECGVWEIYSQLPTEGVVSKFRKETPVSLYFSKEGKYTIGILTIEVYNL